MNKTDKTPYVPKLSELNPDKPTVLGLDLSLNHTGVVCLDAAGTVIYCETIEPIGPKKKPLPDQERKDAIVHRLAHIVMLAKPNYCCMEGYSFGSKGRALTEIHELGGIVKLMLHKMQIPVRLIAPMTLKKFAASDGHADKNKVMLEVYKRWDLEFHDDNQTDAFVLAIIGISLRESLAKNSDPKVLFSKTLPAFQLDILNRLWSDIQ